ncbi:MAG: hypothetical protein AVDCRST_MAG21-474 [uncultured Nocardioidaceae bacterium]|uniref:DUF4439 domain-containing protein n=1 Tax=uncultured Nocardioidaceae bacterium TaxID=253824 RepID=A0A6J4MWN2_9ACTN|nr:MAG: hypothetical protein AVDCRST_MAG21-474 [uncultured Nocardioidaceae bacterium]
MTAVEALQACLQAEHATVYGYGVVGGRLAAVGGRRWQALAASAYAEHRTLRDGLIEVIDGALDAAPVAAEASYTLPFAVRTFADCRRLARLLEARCSTVYANAVAETVDDTRALVAAGLRDTAVRSLRWGAPVEAFPGITPR